MAVNREVMKQLFLPGMEELGKNEPARNGGGFSDPAFASNKSERVHRWVPWIAGFSSEFVREAIGKCVKDRGTILDPFAGVGTTLVEAMRGGHKAIGFEINPYAALACQVKVNSYLVTSH